MEKRKKEDLRITKTKRELRKALLDLLVKESIDKITVRDICRCAPVNRMTFYKHYRDKYDLLNDIVENIRLTILEEAGKTVPEAERAERPVDFIFALTSAAIGECLRLKEILCSGANDAITIAMIFSSLHKDICGAFEDLDAQRKLRYSAPMLSYAVTGAIANLMVSWMGNHPEISPETFLADVGQLLRDLFSSGIFYAEE